MTLPEAVEAEELTKTEDAQIVTQFRVSITGPGLVDLEVCESEVYECTLTWIRVVENFASQGPW